ncbi:MAG: hypothetical protein K8R90_11625 [Candidatus Cloacimonetes bacterium]|nr:hypothetical protein [Candidatus Cloacimonadota bacterium]
MSIFKHAFDKCDYVDANFNVTSRIFYADGHSEEGPDVTNVKTCLKSPSAARDLAVMADKIRKKLTRKSKLYWFLWTLGQCVETEGIDNSEVKTHYIFTFEYSGTFYFKNGEIRTNSMTEKIKVPL